MKMASQTTWSKWPLVSIGVGDGERGVTESEFIMVSLTSASDHSTWHLSFPKEGERESTGERAVIRLLSLAQPALSIEAATPGACLQSSPVSHQRYHLPSTSSTKLVSSSRRKPCGQWDRTKASSGASGHPSGEGQSCEVCLPHLD